MVASFPTGHNCALRACGYRCSFLLLAVDEDVIRSGLLIALYDTNNFIGIGSPGHVWPETFLCECVKQILVCLSTRMGWFPSVTITTVDFLSVLIISDK